MRYLKNIPFYFALVNPRVEFLLQVFYRIFRIESYQTLRPFLQFQVEYPCGDVVDAYCPHDSMLEPDVILEASHGLTDVILLAGKLFAIPGYRNYLARHMFLVVGVTGTHDQLDGVVRICKNLEMNVGRHAERTTALGHVGELAELDGLAGILGTSKIHINLFCLI